MRLPPRLTLITTAPAGSRRKGRVQLAPRVPRERQKTHQDVASGEERGKLVSAGKKRRAGNPLARPAPDSKLESEWLESTQCSDAQHAGPHDSHAPQPRVDHRDFLPYRAPLLVDIADQLSMRTQHRHKHPFVHAGLDARFNHANEMDITRDAGRVDVIHAGANGIDDFEVRKLFPNFRRDIPGQQAGYIIRIADLRPGAKIDLGARSLKICFHSAARAASDFIKMVVMTLSALRHGTG